MKSVKNLFRKIKKYINDRPKLRKIIGAVLILIGFISLITPLTPGSWLIIIGLEFFGVRMLFWDKITMKFKVWLQKVILWYNSLHMKKVGKVTHYYDNLGVAIVKLESSLKVGDKIKFEGHGTDFEQTVDSLQIERKQVEKASTGEVVGLKTEQKVREGTEVGKV